MELELQLKQLIIDSLALGDVGVRILTLMHHYLVMRGWDWIRWMR